MCVYPPPPCIEFNVWHSRRQGWISSELNLLEVHSLQRQASILSKEAASYVAGMETSATVMDGNRVVGLYPLDWDL